MKKTRFIALVLVAALMLAGAGYAAWTDKLEVNTTVSTGELSVAFVGPENPGGGNYYSSPRMFYLHKDAPGASTWNWASATPNDLLTSKVTYGEKVMTFEFGNMYPGTRACGLYTMENNGTIAAVIDNVTVTTNTLDEGLNGPEVLAAMRVTHSWLKIFRDGVAVDSKYIQDIPLANLENELETFFRGKRLQPNDKIVLGAADFVADDMGEIINETFNFELPYDSLEGDEGENEVIEIKIAYDFAQHNVFDPTPEVTPTAE